MIRTPFIAAGLLCIGLMACALRPSLQTSWYRPMQGPQPTPYDQTPRSAAQSPCANALAYQPQLAYPEHTPIKYVRVNVHWMNSADGTANLDGWKAVNYTRGMIHAANYALENNRQMWLPHGNNTPLLPTQFRYVLTGRPNDPHDEGIYFHYDDSLYYYVHIGRTKANFMSRAPIDKYGVQLDTVLNIFVMPYHLDSMRKSSFKGEQVGVALGNAIKIAGPWVRMWTQDYNSFWQTRGNINHEVGHIYGLAHAWGNDGCDDTPAHRQTCFNREDPGCDTLTSNNVMDYVALQVAWSPCQIGRVQARMADERAKVRKLLQPNWCTLHEDRHIFIQDTVVWQGAKDLEGHLTVRAGGHLTVQCRLSLPADGKITVEPGGVLLLDGARLHNACGEEWLGIEMQAVGNLRGLVLERSPATIEDALWGWQPTQEE